MADLNAISTQFTTFYYTTFDTNRTGLEPLYVGLIYLPSAELEVE